MMDDDVRNGSRLLLHAVAAIPVSCATMKGGGNAGQLAGSDWRLAELSERVAVPAEPSRRPWLRFDSDSGRVVGSGGCNRLSGPFTTDGAAIKFGAIVSTKMACADNALNRQEIDFHTALGNADRYEVKSDTLTLRKGSDALATFVR